MDVDKLAAMESSRVGKLLGKIIEKRYPHPVKEVPVEELFSWNLWPKYIIVYGMCTSVTSAYNSVCYTPMMFQYAPMITIDCRPKLNKGLPEHCQTACKFAKEAVIDLCNRMKSGEVKVREIKTVMLDFEYMVKLYEAAYGLGSKGGRDAVFFANLATEITKRKEEYEKFIEIRAQLLYLCRKIHVEVHGMITYLDHVLYTYIFYACRSCRFKDRTWQ